MHLVLQVRYRAERRSFGHAPCVQNLHAVFFLVCLYHGKGSRRPTHDHRAYRRDIRLIFAQVLQQHVPDRGHACGECDFLLLDEVGDGFADELVAGVDHFRPCHARRERNAPAHDMEHRHDGQNDVAARHCERVTHRDAHRVQKDRAVRIEHTFGFTRCARCIAHACRGVLIKRGKIFYGAFIGDQRFVIGHAFELNAGIGCKVIHHDKFLHGLELRFEVGQRFHQRLVAENKFIFRVVDDVDELLGKQANVERVQNGAESGHGEVELHMAVAVPRESRDSVTGFDAEFSERLHQLQRTRVEFAIGIAVQAAVGEARDDFLFGKVLLRAHQNAVDRQRVVHHQAVHGR